MEPSVFFTQEPALRTLVDLCLSEMHADEVWLFGSRARGDEHEDSDWDLIAVIPDDAPEEIGSLRQAFEIRRRSGLHADLLTARSSDFEGARHVVNTIAYDVEREGVLLGVAQQTGTAG